MEFVYVVKRYDLFERSFPHGFVPHRPGSADDPVGAWLQRIRERGFFLERDQAERDSSFKQVIPYTVVVHGDELLLLRRLATGGEARLHGKHSIGVGGHINPLDRPEPETDLLAAACRRELDEELVLDTPYTLSTLGIINDESQDVGSVHFGLVNMALCETPQVRVRETDQLEGGFVSRTALRELAADPERPFETWSALILERLDEALALEGAPA